MLVHYIMSAIVALFMSGKGVFGRDCVQKPFDPSCKNYQVCHLMSTGVAHDYACSIAILLLSTPTS